MHFLYLFLLLTPAVLSNPAPDIPGSGPSSPSTSSHLTPRDGFKTVYPIDPGNTEQIAETVKFLNETYGNEDVVTNKGTSGNLFWKIHLKDGDTTDKLENYDGLSMDNPETRQKGAMSNTKRSILIPRDDGLYMAAPKDSENVEETKKTREFLDSKVKDKNLINEVSIQDKVLLWGHLELDDEAKAEVEKYSGISGLSEDRKLGNNRAVAYEDRSGFVRGLYKGVEKQASRLTKRALSWKKQPRAASDLITDSAYPGSPRLSNFVHEAKAGGDVYIYVIDEGVAIDVENNDPKDKKEFKTNNRQVIQSELSEKANEDKYTDDCRDVPSHGTMVASKALGRKYGVAKEATLIPVKIVPEESDLIQGVALAMADIQDKEAKGDKNRALKSVVLMSKAIIDVETDRNKVLNDPTLQPMHTIFRALNDMGTPVILAAGNSREGDKRKNIDTFPQVLQGAVDTAIINVGAADTKGNRAPFSQGGDQLTIYAPGLAALCQTKENGKTDAQPGTSYAAPSVAGIIATYLAYDQPPWDQSKKGLERVQAIIDYIVSDKSSYERSKGSGVNMIWNGADKAAHDTAGTQECPVNQKRQEGDEGDACSEEPPPPPEDPPEEPPKEEPVECAGATETRYIMRDNILKVIDEFCAEAAEQETLDKDSGSISRTKNEGKVTEVAIAMDWEPGLDFKPDEQKCKDYFHEITDGCDTTSDRFKGGGSKKVGDVTYRWNPEKDHAFWAGCRGDYDGDRDTYEVWGAGWAHDGGTELFNNIKGKAISPTDWDFQWGEGDDDREWTVTFNTIIWAEDRIEPSIEDVAGHDVDVECD